MDEGIDFKSLLSWVGAIALILIIFVFGAIWLGFHIGEKSAFQQGTGNLCGNVPEPYNTIFEAAGKKFSVQPAFIAAIFYGGEHGNSWPDADGPWASSPKGAQGPFQFMPATWENHKQDGNGDGVMDVQNLWDAAFGAAHLLSNIGAGGNTTDLDNLRDAASKYNSGRPWSIGQGIPETAKYVPRVIEAFQSFYCAPELAISTGKWIWPVDGKITSRFGDPRNGYSHDGLDIAAPRGTPIKSVDGGRVNKVHLGASDNSCGVYVIIEHTGGLNSIYCHMVEGSPTVTAGQAVSQGQVIGQVDSTASAGHSTGDHLHLGATLNGTKVDPMNYLPPR